MRVKRAKYFRISNYIKWRAICDKMDEIGFCTNSDGKYQSYLLPPYVLVVMEEGAGGNNKITVEFFSPGSSDFIEIVAMLKNLGCAEEIGQKKEG